MALNNSPGNNAVWKDLLAEEAFKEAQRIISDKRRTARLSKYASNPVGFGKEILGETYTDDVIAVMNSVRDNPVTLARSGNATGKTHGAARVAVWFFRVFQDAQVFLTAAPPFENLRNMLWGEVMSIVGRRPEMFKDDVIRTLSVTRDARSFIKCVAIPTSGTAEERQTKFSGKHAPHLLFVVDEGDAVPEEVYRGIESCMSGGMARMLVMFNPKIQTGHLYNMETSKKANVVHLSAIKHPNVLSGENIIPGAVDREITVRRIHEWTRPLAAEEKQGERDFNVPDFLIGSVASSQDGTKYPPLQAGLRRVIDESFYYMVLGEYPAQGERQLISEEWIARARARHDAYVAMFGDVPPAGTKGIMGLDIAEFGGDYNVAAIRYGGYVKLDAWTGVDTDVSAMRGLKIYREKGCDIAFIDATGIGAGVAPRMARAGRDDDVRALGVKVANSPSKKFESENEGFYQLRDQLWWFFAHLAREG